METLGYLFNGFGIAFQPINLFWVTLGGVLGTIIGMLPGLGPATGVACLLPLTFAMGPEGSLITMAGIYYGAMFGGSRASILLNVPGDGAAIASCFDGYPMSKNGRAEAALAISAIASFIGGILATLGMVSIALPIARMALKFGSAEYFMIFAVALSAAAVLSEGNKVKGFVSMIIGLMIATIGIDPQSGVRRFTFGILTLDGGIDFLVVIIAVYALGEVFKSFGSISDGSTKIQTKFGKIWITKEDWKRSFWTILRSTPIGFLVGALPGCGGTMASLMAYSLEKQIGKHPDEMGKGAIEGLAAPEAANNASSVGALIPMLTLGIPGSGTTAVMLGALLLLGFQPGPLLFAQQPNLVWGLIASMFIGNIILAIINIPLAGLLVRLLAVPPKILYPIVLGLAFVGCYAITSSVTDFYILVIFGLVGYFMMKAKIPITPLMLAVIVGTTTEQYFRRGLKISNGNIGYFFGSPLAIALFIILIVSIAAPFIMDAVKKKKLIK